MIQPVTAAAAPPIAYAGGAPSTSKPGFGAALQGTLTRLQATNQGITATHHHHGHAGHKPAGQAGAATDPFGSAPFTAASLAAAPL